MYEPKNFSGINRLGTEGEEIGELEDTGRESIQNEI